MLGCPPPQETYRDDLFPGGMGGARRVPEAFAPSCLRGERPYHPARLRSRRAILVCAPARALLRGQPPYRDSLPHWQRNNEGRPRGPSLSLLAGHLLLRDHLPGEAL